MSYDYYDYLTFRTQNPKIKRDTQKNNNYVVYVEKKLKPESKSLCSHESESHYDNYNRIDSNNHYKSTNYEKRNYTKKKTSYNEVHFYYEPKVLDNNENQMKNQDDNGELIIRLDKEDKKCESETENLEKKSKNHLSFEKNEMKNLISQTNFEQTMQTIKTENFKNEEADKKNHSENNQFVENNETEKKILSRKSSNTIDNIINNVFDSAALNDNSWNYSNEDKLFDSKFDNDNNINNSLYDDGDDFELDFIFQKKNQTPDSDGKNSWERYHRFPENPLQTKETNFIPNSSNEVQYPELKEAFQIWNNNYFVAKPNSHNNASRMNQINHGQKGSFDGQEIYFKDLFPINFDHSKFPIFGLFIQRIPNHDILEEVWYYKDPQRVIQGPFKSTDMDYWNNDGYFSLKLMIAWNQNNEFLTIEEFIKNPQSLIKISSSYTNLAKYFYNRINYENLITQKQQKKTEEKYICPLSFNSFSTSVINNPNYNRTLEKISTESLKGLLGIQSNKHFVGNEVKIKK